MGLYPYLLVIAFVACTKSWLSVLCMEDASLSTNLFPVCKGVYFKGENSPLTVCMHFFKFHSSSESK